MGKGIDLARAESPAHAQALDDFKDQLLIVLIKRLGGKISVPVAEADDTGGNLLMMNIENNIFNFEVRQKS
jgi:hypothetical protein